MIGPSTLRRWVLGVLPGLDPGRDRLADLAQQLDHEDGGDARPALFRAMTARAHFGTSPSDPRLAEILDAVHAALREGEP